jgi:hypothetical protein
VRHHSKQEIDKVATEGTFAASYSSIDRSASSKEINESNFSTTIFKQRTNKLVQQVEAAAAAAGG